MTKNILFATFFAMMVLIFFVATDDDDDNIFKRPTIFYASSISICFLMILFIVQGIYIFIFGMLFGLLLMKGFSRKTLKSNGCRCLSTLRIYESIYCKYL